MIVFASLLFAQAVSAYAPGLDTPPTETILTPIPVAVLEQRLPAMEAVVAQDSDGGWSCTLNGTSGSAYVDDRFCQATARCSIRLAVDQDRYDKCLRSERKDIIKKYHRFARGKS